MADTIVDMPKVTQMLDAGWSVRLLKNGIGSYTAAAKGSREKWQVAKDRCLECYVAALGQNADRETLKVLKVLNDSDFDHVGVVMTNDFTPEKALTRLAYKVHGEII